MNIILNQYGSFLRKDNRMFVAGNTQREDRFPVHDITKIMVAPGVNVTSDAMLLALRNDIDLIFMDKNGLAQGRIWNSRFGSIASIRNKQLHFTATWEGKRWIQQFISNKIDWQMWFLHRLRERKQRVSQQVDQASEKLATLRSQVLNMNLHSSTWAQTLRGLEGQAARAYFPVLSAALPAEYRFDDRSRQPPRDLFNACLSFSYALLYTEVESAMINAGLDPFLGVFHRVEHNRPSFVYDFIEPYRVWIDRFVFDLFNQHQLQTHHSQQAPGTSEGIWLNDEGRKILLNAYFDYMDTVIQHRGKRRSRKTHIYLDASGLASQIQQKINYENL